MELDKNGEDFFTSEGIVFVLSVGCGGEYDASDNCFSISAEGHSWWRHEAALPSVEEASARALKWILD